MFTGDGVFRLIERSRAEGSREFRLGFSARKVKPERLAKVIESVLGGKTKIEKSDRVEVVGEAKERLITELAKFYTKLPEWLWPRKVYRLLNSLKNSRTYKKLFEQLELEPETSLRKGTAQSRKRMR